MKRTLLTFIIITAYICGLSAKNDAMFVYRNNGVINAFLKVDVDSMKYSRLDPDSVFHKDYVVQEVWTPDSVYRIPLAEIDSVSFVTPPTVYKNDVTRIDEDLLDYVIGCDGLTLKLMTSTPAVIRPKPADKLVLLEGCRALPYGFSGIVKDVQEGYGYIAVRCEPAYLEDLFDSFCSVTTMYGTDDAPMYITSQRGPSHISSRPEDRSFKLGPFTSDLTAEISQGITPDGNLALKGGEQASISVSPKFRIHSFLAMGEGQGTYFSCSITGEIDIEHVLSVYCGIEYSKDIDFNALKVNIPIPCTGYLVNYYFIPGFFGRIGATVSSTLVQNYTYAFGMAYDYSSFGENVIKPSLGCRLASSSTENYGLIEGNVALGAFFETGFNLLSREIAKVCVRGELGMQAKGDFVLRNPDIEGSKENTKLYERLKASSIDIGPFGNVSLQGSAENTGISLTFVEDSKSLKKWDIVPTFLDTKFERSSEISYEGFASTRLVGNCLYQIPFGFKLADMDDNEINKSTFKYFKDKELNFSYKFSGLDPTKSYKVYPKLNLFGYEILASPEAKLDKKDPPFCTDGSHTHYIDLGLPSGTLWACCNEGASRPEENGKYFRLSEVSSAPSREQIEELIKYTYQYSCELNGVKGVKFVGKNGHTIFLPYAGSHQRSHGRHESDEWVGVGVGGRYWSSSIINPESVCPDVYSMGISRGAASCDALHPIGCYDIVNGLFECQEFSLRKVR